MTTQTLRRRMLRIAALGAVVAGTVGVNAAPAAASPYGGIATVCASAPSVTEYWAIGQSWNDFKALDQNHFNNGLRIAQLDIDGKGVTAVWQPGSGEQRVRWNMSFDDFKSWDAYYFGQGLRLAELDRDGGDWAAVWRPGSGAQYWRAGIPSWTDFKNQDAVYFSQGLRLVDVIITADNDITGVWRGDQGDAAQIWQSGMLNTGADSHNHTAFDNINNANKRDGYELKILKTHPNDAYVMAVWRYRGGSFGQADYEYQTVEAFKGSENDCRAQGMHIVSMDVK
jgi:hypothetical protein